MSETKTFEIYYDDLNEDTQNELCRIFKTIPEEENWDIIPLATIEREISEE